MSTNRPRVPTDVQTQLLTSCKRRCCLCFGLDKDRRVKEGQIAHNDQDPTNNDEDNLVWLCLAHHDQRDTRRSQTKGFTTDEVKHYKKSLIESLSASPQKKEPTRSRSQPKDEELMDLVRRYNSCEGGDARVVGSEIVVRFDKYVSLGNAHFNEDIMARGESKTAYKQQLLNLPCGLWGPSFECQFSSNTAADFRRRIRKWAAGKLTPEECAELYWDMDEEWDMDTGYIFFGYPNSIVGALGHAYLRAEFHHVGCRNISWQAEKGSRLDS